MPHSCPIRAIRFIRGQYQPGQSGDRAGRQHGSRPAQGLQRGDARQAAQRSARQVRPVEAPRLLRPGREGQGDDGAGEEEGNRQVQVDQCQPDHLLPGQLRPVQVGAEGDLQVEDKGDGDGEGQGQSPPPQPAAHPVGPGQVGEEVEHHPGDGAPRQRQGDRQKGEVVPHGDGEDPGDGHLQDERAHAGQEDAEKVTTV